MVLPMRNLKENGNAAAANKLKTEYSGSTSYVIGNVHPDDKTTAYAKYW
jgi:hypothetical protein